MQPVVMSAYVTEIRLIGQSEGVLSAVVGGTRDTGLLMTVSVVVPRHIANQLRVEDPIDVQVSFPTLHEEEHTLKEHQSYNGNSVDHMSVES